MHHAFHGELSEGDVELSTPDGEVAHLVNGRLLRRQQQDHVLVVVTADNCPNLRVGSENGKCFEFKSIFEIVSFEK
jgi:hypothetical protein